MSEFEQEYDDRVYEDDYYDENYEEEELVDEDDYFGDGDDDESSSDEVEVSMSFACDDCDYRWDDVIVKKKGEDAPDVVCPMCGSMNITQI